jgi:SagB-type dehydrogenase family enzyme
MDATGERFMEETRYESMGPTDQERGLPQPALDAPAPFAEVQRLDLPDPREIQFPEMGLVSLFETRRSLRTYGDGGLSLEELSFLLWATQGVKRIVPGKATFRTVPSAGARHPFETALLVHRVDGLTTGLYWFRALEARLSQLDAPLDIGLRLSAACLDQPFIAQSAAVFIWVADAYRTTWRYGARGYRYLHLDAGHVCENLYLAAESIGAGACAIGAFSDDLVNAALGLDGTGRFVVYLAAVGKRPAG